MLRFPMSWFLRSMGMAAIASWLLPVVAIAQPLPFPIGSPHANVEARGRETQLQTLIRQTTVRLLTAKASGSGAIVQRRGQVYTVLTNWHVVSFSQQHEIMTADGRRHVPIRPPQKVGNADLAIVQFRSNVPYAVAKLSREPLVEGDRLYAAGFPMYYPGSFTPTFDRGIQGFRLTVGHVSLLLPKALYQGYRLGYSNEIEAGMSGGPIFNQRGELVGINGRVKHRDPDFGVYAFEDGTEPSPALLSQMMGSSWGIPIATYLRFASPPTVAVPHSVALPRVSHRRQLPPAHPSALTGARLETPTYSKTTLME